MLYDPKRDIGTTGRILLGAADILERGWCKGYECNDKGHHCAIGAIRKAANEMGLPSADAHVAQECLRQYLGRPVATWNDALGVTKEQVTATLRSLAFERAIRTDALGEAHAVPGLLAAAR